MEVPNDSGGSEGGSGNQSDYTRDGLKDMLIADAVGSGSSGHIDVSTEASEELVEADLGSGDYAYVDRIMVVRMVCC